MINMFVYKRLHIYTVHTEINGSRKSRRAKFSV